MQSKIFSFMKEKRWTVRYLEDKRTELNFFVQSLNESLK
jgi:hypothetical protein